MRLWPDLSKRAHEAEIMDSLDSDPVGLANTLEQFRAINRWLTPCQRLLRRYFLDAMKQDRQRAWTLLDVGSGGGDLAIWLVGRCRKLGISIDITGVDHDPRVVAFATRKCSAFSNITIRDADARELRSSGETWDFVFCNHFLHHLADDDIVDMLATIHEVASTRFVLSDIYRSHVTYLAYSMLFPLRMTNSFAWHDGRLSIRKGFTIADCRTFVEAAGIADTTSIHRLLPGHLAIVG